MIEHAIARAQGRVEEAARVAIALEQYPIVGHLRRYKHDVVAGFGTRSRNKAQRRMIYEVLFDPALPRSSRIRSCSDALGWYLCLCPAIQNEDRLAVRRRDDPAATDGHDHRAAEREALAQAEEVAARVGLAAQLDKAASDLTVAGPDAEWRRVCCSS